MRDSHDSEGAMRRENGAEEPGKDGHEKTHGSGMLLPTEIASFPALHEVSAEHGPFLQETAREDINAALAGPFTRVNRRKHESSLPTCSGRSVRRGLGPNSGEHCRNVWQR